MAKIISITTEGIRELIGLGILHTEGVHGNGLDFLLGLGTVIIVCLYGGNLIYHIHALCDLAEGRHTGC